MGNLLIVRAAQRGGRVKNTDRPAPCGAAQTKNEPGDQPPRRPIAGPFLGRETKGNSRLVAERPTVVSYSITTPESNPLTSKGLCRGNRLAP